MNDAASRVDATPGPINRHEIDRKHPDPLKAVVGVEVDRTR
jgi:hypothetical protein